MKFHIERMLSQWTKCHILLINQYIYVIKSILFKKANSPKKILIFRIGSLGDSICSIPSIVRIKRNHPNAEIDILTNTGAGKNLVSLSSLLSTNYYSNIINYDTKDWRTLTVFLKSRKYDQVIHLTQQGSSFFKHFRDMLYFRFFLNIKSGAGWEKNTIAYFKKNQEKFLTLENEQKRLDRILTQQLNLQYSSLALYEYIINEDDLDVISVKIQQKKINSSKKSIAIVIGAKRSTNRWPISFFYDTIKHFCENFNIFILGGKDDESLALPLLELPNTYSFCGQLTPIQSGLLFQKCILTLSNDTGPMHLSYSWDTPVIALFSNRDFSRLWYPPEDGKNIVHRSASIPCSLCLLESCPNDNLCMKQISVEKVVDSINSLLNKLGHS